MMKAKIVVIALVSALVLPMFCVPVHAQGTAFTYQGRLAQSGVEVDGSFDLQFGLYTNVSTGNLVGSLLTNSATQVSNGIFTTTLNFSNVFNGTAYWLGIGVRSNGTTNAFVLLTPRQPITPTPYAITASNLTGTLPASQLSGTLPASALAGTFSNGVSFTNLTNIFVGNGAGLTNVTSVTSSNFLYAYDTTSQYVSTAGAYQYITLNTVSDTGWYLPTTGEYEAVATGAYLVSYQAHFYNGSATTTGSIAMRGVVNLTTEIPSSEVVSYLYPNYVVEVSRTFLISLTAGQVLSFQMTGSGSGTGGPYLISSSLYGQFFPSMTVTITRIE